MSQYHEMPSGEDINRAFGAAVRVGEQRGREKEHDFLKGGKRFWMFWPLTLLIGFFLGACFGTAVAALAGLVYFFTG